MQDYPYVELHRVGPTTFDRRPVFDQTKSQGAYVLKDGSMTYFLEQAGRKDLMAALRMEAYRSYLMRVWRTCDEGRTVWRVSLESAQTGEKANLVNLAALPGFLEQELA